MSFYEDELLSAFLSSIDTYPLHISTISLLFQVEEGVAEHQHVHRQHGLQAQGHQPGQSCQQQLYTSYAKCFPSFCRIDLLIVERTTEQD